MKALLTYRLGKLYRAESLLSFRHAQIDVFALDSKLSTNLAGQGSVKGPKAQDWLPRTAELTSKRPNDSRPSAELLLFVWQPNKHR